MTLEPGHHVTYSGKEWVVVKLNENTAIIEPISGKQHERKAVRFSDLTSTGEKEDLNILPEMTKKCKDCQEIKPIRLFGRMSGEGRSLCNDCVTKRAQAQYVKTCTQCGVEKHVGEFDHYRKNQRKNICRECLSVRLKEGHKEKAMEDQVKQPKHYQGTQGLEVIDIMKNFLPKYQDGYVAGMIKDVIKYILRAPSKDNLLQDLKKAREYLNYAIEYLEAG